MIKQWVGGSAHHKGVEKQGLGGLEGDTSHPAAAAPQLRYQMRSGGQCQQDIRTRRQGSGPIYSVITL